MKGYSERHHPYSLMVNRIFVASLIPPPFKPSITKMGSSCPVARRLDAVDIGHCDECGCVWCLNCERIIITSKLPVNELEEMVSRHYKECESFTDYEDDELS